MKKHLLFILMLLSVHNLCVCQHVRIDTIYYDKEWNIVPIKEFADFYRIAVYSDSDIIKNRFRDYYITGQLQSEGSFISIDRFDDTKSVWDGEIIQYYKNGNIKSCCHYANGKLDGKLVDYYEDGTIWHETNMINDKMDGEFFQFNEDGSVIQLEYSKGEPTKPYYYYMTKDGLSSKISLETNKVYWQYMTPSERKSIYRNGTPWQYYVQNNLMVALTNTIVRDHGQWFRVDLVITNNSVAPIEFDPSMIEATVYDKRGNIKGLKSWTYNQFVKKVTRDQNWTAALVGIAEGMATANAGKTTSTTNTNTYYSGYSNTYGNVSAYGNNGNYAFGSFSVNGNYSGNSYTSTTTNTYNASEAYQTRLLSQQRIASLENAQWQERASINEGYLKKTTIYPGESVRGFVYLQRVKGKKISIDVPVCGVLYQYDWVY